MKIKAVCEITGLTPRAVRLYIEELLISPKFTENYLGRRTFDFSQEDVIALQNIATLRKYSFSIDEIRKILIDPQNSISVIEIVKERTKNQLADDCERMNALARLEKNKVYSVSELSKILEQTAKNIKLPTDLPKINIGRIIISVVSFIIVWLPFALAFLGFLLDITTYSYPKINPRGIVFTLITLLPSVMAIFVSKIRFQFKKAIKTICLCIFSIPWSFLFPLAITERSETTDFRNYRDFDPGCLANRNIVFQELFPLWPTYFDVVKNENGDFKTIYLDSKYYYQYFRGFDYTYDIYAEWSLKDDVFISEVQRVERLFEKSIKNKTYGYDYAEIEKGNFTCLILYNGDEPFHSATDNYQYVIFAYNEADKIVRYVFCDSLENGVDQPYYLQLEW